MDYTGLINTDFLRFNRLVLLFKRWCTDLEALILMAINLL